MKKVFGFLCVVLMIFLISSCSSTEEIGRIGMYPMRNIPVGSIEDLQSGSFEILGTVSGEGSVDVDDPSNGDTHGYGSLELLDADRMYFDINTFVVDDPYYISLSNAVNEMIKQAREMDASFVTFPSYTIDLVEDRVVSVVSATAVKLINAPSEQSEPAAAGTLNISMQ